MRYLTNRSSGKMGYALAQAAARRGARVILVSGPTRLDPPQGVEFVPVRSTEEMHRAVLEHFAGRYRADHGRGRGRLPARGAADQEDQARRGISRWSWNPRPTFWPMSARGKGERDYHRVCRGDRATWREHARGKLESKQADLIVANDVTAEGAGFDHDTNVITLYRRDGSEKPFPRMPKIRRGAPHPRSGFARCATARPARFRRNAAGALTFEMDSPLTQTHREKLEAGFAITTI